MKFYSWLLCTGKGNFVLGMQVLCQCKRLQWAVAATGLIMTCWQEKLWSKGGIRTQSQFTFSDTFAEAFYSGKKKIDWGLSKFSETFLLFIFDQTRNEKTTGKISPFQGADLKGRAMQICHLLSLVWTIQ